MNEGIRNVKFDGGRKSRDRPRQSNKSSRFERCSEISPHIRGGGLSHPESRPKSEGKKHFQPPNWKIRERSLEIQRGKTEISRQIRREKHFQPRKNSFSPKIGERSLEIRRGKTLSAPKSEREGEEEVESYLIWVWRPDWRRREGAGGESRRWQEREEILAIRPSSSKTGFASL